MPGARGAPWAHSDLPLQRKFIRVVWESQLRHITRGGACASTTARYLLQW
jgi:hypothetical protein